jgi:hypothetical protein
MLEHLKVAAYLEDAGEDPVSACQTMREAGITNAVIRHVWTSNIKDLSDNGCVKLRKILSDHQITPVAIVSAIGDVPATELPNVPVEAIDRTFNLAAYFSVPMLGLTCGRQVPEKADTQIAEWFDNIQHRSVSANLLPLMEITTKSHLYAAAETVLMLARFSRIKLLYDPAQLIIKQNVDPFVKYWTLWKQYVGAIDVRDYKIGRGYKPVGFGDTQIARTVLDAIRSKYTGWFFFEPSLGRRHGTAYTKGDVFKSAFAAFCNVISQS